MNEAVILRNSGVPPARCFCDYDQDNCEVGVSFVLTLDNGTEVTEVTNVWDRVRFFWW